jgi:hypothetical protein
MEIYNTWTYHTRDKDVQVLGVSSWYDSRMEFLDNAAAGRKVYETP